MGRELCAVTSLSRPQPKGLNGILYKLQNILPILHVRGQVGTSTRSSEGQELEARSPQGEQSADACQPRTCSLGLLVATHERQATRQAASHGQLYEVSGSELVCPARLDVSARGSEKPCSQA